MTAIRALPPAPLSVLLAAATLAAPFGYCYRTLADVVCYPAPDRGREARFTGSYPLDPKADPSPGTAPVCGAGAAAASPRDLLAGTAAASPPPCAVASPPQ